MIVVLKSMIMIWVSFMVIWGEVIVFSYWNFLVYLEEGIMSLYLKDKWDFEVSIVGENILCFYKWLRNGKLWELNLLIELFYEIIDCFFFFCFNVLFRLVWLFWLRFLGRVSVVEFRFSVVFVKYLGIFLVWDCIIEVLVDLWI